MAVNSKNTRAEERTPEKGWLQPERDSRQSRSKSRSKVTNNLAYGGVVTSDRKRGLANNLSTNQHPTVVPGGGRPKPVKSSVVNRKQPAAGGRLFSGQVNMHKGSDRPDYNALHEELITEILKEEEEVLSQHKDHIDAMYKSTKIVGLSNLGS